MLDGLLFGKLLLLEGFSEQQNLVLGLGILKSWQRNILSIAVPLDLNRKQSPFSTGLPHVPFFTWEFAEGCLCSVVCAILLHLAFWYGRSSQTLLIEDGPVSGCSVLRLALVLERIMPLIVFWREERHVSHVLVAVFSSVSHLAGQIMSHHSIVSSILA